MAKLINEVGNVYGYLTVKSRAEDWINPSGKKRVQWNCVCRCGREIIVLGESLRKGRTKSCGKCGLNTENREKTSDKLCEELIGKEFGFLEVLSAGDYETTSDGKRRRKVICKCKLCENIIQIRTNYLKSGDVESCGCLKKSRGEIFVEKYLKDKNYSYKKEFIFKDLQDKLPLRFDFVIFQNNNVLACIEIQGSQHYNELNGWYNLDIIRHDKMKQEYCLNNNYPLIILDYSLGQSKTNFEEWKDQIERVLKNDL